jgi:hypothetical protein
MSRDLNAKHVVVQTKAAERKAMQKRLDRKESEALNLLSLYDLGRYIRGKPIDSLERTKSKYAVQDTRLAKTGEFTMSGFDAPVSTGIVVRGMRMRPLRIRHSELLIPSLSGTTQFTAANIPINPGKADVFPWLSQLGGLFEKYRVVDMCFKYIPSSATSSIGNIIMGFDYDSYDSLPFDKSALMMFADSCSVPTWHACDLELDRRDLRSRGQLYIRSTGFSGDLKTYDLGNFVYATQGQADTSIIGDIYVEYLIEFLIPTAPSAVPSSNYDTSLGGFGTVDAAHPFGTTSGTDSSFGSVFTMLTTSGGNNVSFRCDRSGIYLVTLIQHGTALTGLNTAMNGSTGSTVSLIDRSSGTTPGVMIWAYKVVITEPLLLNMNFASFSGTTVSESRFIATLLDSSVPV